MDKHYLHALFNCRHLVLITEAASNWALANEFQTTFDSAGFKGTVRSVDLADSASVLAENFAQSIDLAVVCVSDERLTLALEVAGRMRCQSVIVLGHGLPASLAASLHQLARQHRMQLLGPNSLGMQRPHLGLNASVMGTMASAGSLALVSQSGSLTSSVLDWAHDNGIGFSTVVSVGPHSAIDLADVLDFLAADGRTQSIVVYMEGIQNARSFMSALRAAASVKPVVVLKAGRKEGANQAAQTHSQAMAGSDEVFDSALRRAGAVRVRSFVQLFSAVKCLSVRYKPVGKRLGVLTNGGGPGVLAADWISELGLTLAALHPDKAQALRAQLPPLASLDDLVDVSESAGPEAYEAALEVMAQDTGIDGILVLHSPQFGVDPVQIAEVVGRVGGRMGKPVLACWMGDASMKQARQVLSSLSVPTFRTPETAVGAFGNISSFYENQQLLQQTPPPLTEMAKPDVQGARLLIENVLAERRYALTEVESKALLAAFHIPVTQAILARNANEAMLIAAQLGYPVAMKIDSPDIMHKTDVQGVALNVVNAASVREVFQHMVENVQRLAPQARINGVTLQKMAGGTHSREVCVGLVTDQPFGPVLTFGAGGTMIELIHDRSMELPPLNQFLARRMIERSRMLPLLHAWRGSGAVNMESLEHILLRVSEMVCALPQLKEMDINPIMVDAQGAVAVDARIVLQEPVGGLREHGHLAILPYPSRYERVWPMRGGGEYLVRPMHPDDANMLQGLVQRLSPESRYFRFVSTLTELPAHMLARLSLIDYEREMALVAVIRETDEQGQEQERIIAVSRYITNVDRRSCEFSLLVDDGFSGKGLGSKMMQSIMEVARDRGLEEIDGLVLANNSPMLKLMRSLGFTVRSYEEDPDFKVASHRL